MTLKCGDCERAEITWISRFGTVCSRGERAAERRSEVRGARSAGRDPALPNALRRLIV